MRSFACQYVQEYMRNMLLRRFPLENIARFPSNLAQPNRPLSLFVYFIRFIESYIGKYHKLHDVARGMESNYGI